jgi:hypothetical protein
MIFAETIVNTSSADISNLSYAFWRPCLDREQRDVIGATQAKLR